jgi:F-type H+-transporting ATPase subunit alpha
MNVGLSVSRVGGKTQAPAMKDQAQTLRLEYAQFLELEVFARFGGMIDERTRKTVEHGKRIRAILSQPQYAPLSLAVHVALLLAVNEKRLDPLPLDTVARFKVQLPAWLQEQCPRVVHQVETEGKLSDENKEDMLAAIDSLVATLKPAEEPVTTDEVEGE